MEHKLNYILNNLVKISTKINTINHSEIQNLLHDWTHQSQLINMSYDILKLIEPYISTLNNIHPLQQQLQKQESNNRQMIRKQLLLHQKMRQLQQQYDSIQIKFNAQEKQQIRLKESIVQLQFELTKTTKSFSLQLGEKQLLINKLESNINLLNDEKFGKTMKDKSNEKDKLKKIQRHKRGRSDDPILSRRQKIKNIR